MSRRHNGEGSIYPVKDGYRGYVWCTNPDGTRYRKYVKGKTYEATQRHGSSSGTRQATDRSLRRTKLGDFLSYWLKEIVRPNLAPKTYRDIRAVRTSAHCSSPWA